MKRDANLDLIRCVAVLFVLILHFILYSGWYLTPNVDFSHWFMNMLRALFLNCVPLFMLLTGYLCCRRELSARYYLGLVRIYVLYLFSCLASLLVRHFALGEILSLRSVLYGVLNHRANSYSWYVAMYTGLFLLIPFLNLAWAGLKTRRKRLVLLGTMLYLTALPGLLNLRHQIYLVWWASLYPLTYYFIGAYIREYRRKLRPGPLALVLLAALAGAAAVNFFLSRPEGFVFVDGNNYEGFQAQICSVLLFLLLLNLDLSRCPKGLAAGIRWLSGLSFPVYLFSNATDLLVYSLCRKLIPRGGAWVYAYALGALASLLLCIPLAWLAERLAHPLIKGIKKGLSRLYRRLTPKKAE